MRLFLASRPSDGLTKNGGVILSWSTTAYTVAAVFLEYYFYAYSAILPVLTESGKEIVAKFLEFLCGTLISKC